MKSPRKVGNLASEPISQSNQGTELVIELWLMVTCHIPDAVGNPSSPDGHALVHEIEARHLQAVLILPVLSHILDLQMNKRPRED